MSHAPDPKEALSLLHDMIFVGYASSLLQCLALATAIGQVYTYWRAFPKDRAAFRFLVGSLLVLLPVYLAIIIWSVVALIEHALYTPGASFFNVPTAIFWLGITQSLLIVFTAALVEGFFLYRMLGVTKTVGIRAAAMLLYAGTLGLLLTGTALNFKETAEAGHPFSKTVAIVESSGLWCSLSLNFGTAVVLSKNLLFNPNRIAKPATTDVVTAWALGSIRTSAFLLIATLGGAITTLFIGSLHVLIINVGFRNAYLPIAALCTLYSLNSREALRRQVGGGPAGMVGTARSNIHHPTREFSLSRSGIGMDVHPPMATLAPPGSKQVGPSSSASTVDLCELSARLEEVGRRSDRDSFV